MTLIAIIQRIKEDHYVDLNRWQKDFIDDIYQGVDGLPNNAADHEIEEYLSQKQINKIYEIAQELGIN